MIVVNTNSEAAEHYQFVFGNPAPAKMRPKESRRVAAGGRSSSERSKEPLASMGGDRLCTCNSDGTERAKPAKSVYRNIYLGVFRNALPSPRAEINDDFKQRTIRMVELVHAASFTYTVLLAGSSPQKERKLLPPTVPQHPSWIRFASLSQDTETFWKLEILSRLF